MGLKLGFKFKGIKNLRKAFDSREVDKIVRDAIFEIATEAEAVGIENISKRIYGQPPSPNYQRTGRALGGHVLRKVKGGRGRKLIFDTRLKGASKNYSPMLNRNRRIERFNTKFFDDMVEDTRKKIVPSVRRRLGKHFRKFKINVNI